MPRKTYDTRAGRQRPRDQRTRYTREQVAQVTGRWANIPSTTQPEREIRT